MQSQVRRENPVRRQNFAAGPVEFLNHQDSIEYVRLLEERTQALGVFYFQGTVALNQIQVGQIGDQQGISAIGIAVLNKIPDPFVLVWQRQLLQRTLQRTGGPE
jgi:hypothetical protein